MHFQLKIKNLYYYKIKKILDYVKKLDLKIIFISRLELDIKKLEAITRSINSISKLKDPTDRILEQWKRPNGLKIKKFQFQ